MSENIYNIYYALSSCGTVVMGILHRLRQSESLTIKQWFILGLALAGWGAISFAILGMYITTPIETRIGVSIALGVGLSELWAILLSALGSLLKSLPSLIEKYLKR